MNILIIANYNINKGGISAIVKNHQKKLKEENHFVKIFNTKKNIILRVFVIFLLIYEVRKYNLVHIHGCSNFGFFPIVVGIIATKIVNKKKAIVTYHGGGADNFLNKHKKFVKKILSKADAVTVMSKYLQSIFLSYDIKTIILPNMIEINLSNFKDKDFLIPKIVSIRSLNKIYNINDIIEAFVKIKDKYPNAMLKVIGDGTEYKKLTKLVKEKMLEDIYFVGRISNERIPEELNKSNILISVPSIDNQPLSILEGFACGLAVISSNVGGIPDIIIDGFNGFLVDTNRPDQIFNKVDWIINNPNKTQVIIGNAKKELRKYTWDSIKKIIYDLYN